MVVAHHVADDLRALAVLGVGGQVLLPHRVEDAALHRLQPVAHVGQRARGDDRERVIEVPGLRRLVQRDRFRSTDRRARVSTVVSPSSRRTASGFLLRFAISEVTKITEGAAVHGPHWHPPRPSSTHLTLCECPHSATSISTSSPRRPFEGNQLAVFPEPAALSTRADADDRAGDELLGVHVHLPAARRGGDVRMRIFTPGEELPMAGHPTIGSTFALAHEGAIARGREDFVFELGVGPTPVSLEWDGDGLSFAWMTQPLPTFGAWSKDRAGFARGRSASAESDLAGRSAGPGRLVRRAVPVRAAAHAHGRRRRRDRSAKALASAAAPRASRAAGVLLHHRGAAADDDDGATAGCSRRASASPRIRRPAAPADRSAATCCSTASCTRAQARAMLSLQGVAMGRPSRIHISIEADGREITRVRVGGQSCWSEGGS